ncbi:MAG: biotin/lipoyl-binding protein [Planctomycetota bacterium]
MSNRSKILTWGLPLAGAASLMLGAGYVAKNRPITPDEAPPRQPTTAPSESASIDATRYIGAVGTSEPPGEPIAIAAHTSGVVTGVRVRVGDAVEVGQPLFFVESSRAEAEVGLRRAEVIVAERDLESLRASIPPRQASVLSASATVESARAELRSAEADLADRKNLLSIATSVTDPRAISRELVDRRRFAVDQAEARVATANASIARAEADLAESEADLSRFVDEETGRDGPEIESAASRVEQARRSLEKAQADLSLLTVRSPVSGTVLQVNIREGEFAPASVPSEGLVVLGRSGPTHLRVEIDEVDIPRFNPAARAWASPRGASGNRVELELVEVEPLVVPKRNLSGRTSELIDTRVLQVVYAIDNSFQSPGVGQQFDVYVESNGGGS